MQFDYAKKRKHTIGKLVVMSLAIALPIIAYFILGFIYDAFDGNDPLDLEILRIIVLVASEAVIATKIVFYARVIASEDFATNYFIKKNDERNVYIKQRTTTFTMKFLLYVLALGMIIAGFFSKMLFYALGSVVAVMTLTYFFTYIYFNKKY